MKKSVPLVFTRPVGEELGLPGLMSSTSVVPADVPSLFQSSTPWVPSFAVKKAVLPTAVMLLGYEPIEPGSMSLTIPVPLAVPSLLKISYPPLGSKAS